MKFDGDSKYILSTGKEFYAHWGILGVTFSEDYMEPSKPATVSVSQGCDGGLPARFEKDFTPEERAEIADYAISLWQKWKEEGE